MDDSRRASDGSRGGDVISVITSPKHASGPIAEPPEQAGAQDCSPHSDAAVPRTSRASAGILLPSVKFNVTVTAGVRPRGSVCMRESPARHIDLGLFRWHCFGPNSPSSRGLLPPPSL